MSYSFVRFRIAAIHGNLELVVYGVPVQPSVVDDANMFNSHYFKDVSYFIVVNNVPPKTIKCTL
jgi:hypothetical protein